MAQTVSLPPPRLPLPHTIQDPNTHYPSDTSLIWTIWTINEPANYIIAACLPTLRPVFLRILPSSFSILSNGRSGKRSSGRNMIMQSPGSLTMLSPLAERRRTQYFPWMLTHRSQCDECWVGIEASQDGGGGGGGGDGN